MGSHESGWATSRDTAHSQATEDIGEPSSPTEFFPHFCQNHEHETLFNSIGITWNPSLSPVPTDYRYTASQFLGKISWEQATKSPRNLIQSTWRPWSNIKGPSDSGDSFSHYNKNMGPTKVPSRETPLIVGHHHWCWNRWSCSCITPETA